MSSLTISLAVFACIAGASLLGMLIARLLPAHHLQPESKDAVKHGIAVIATLSGLVLALLVAAAKGSYDNNVSAVRQLATDVLMLDRLLALYGPETKDLRGLLRHGAGATLARIWPDDAHAASLEPGEAKADLEAFYEKLTALTPKSEAQTTLKSRALDATASLLQTRFRLFSQKDTSIPTPFLVVLVCWLVILLAGYGLLAPRNATVIVVLMICALSLSGALFLILELDRPFDGFVRVPSAPLRDAISRLGS